MAHGLMPAGATLQIEVGVLLARAADELLDAFLASDAGLLVAAERRAEEALGHVVIQTKPASTAAAARYAVTRSLVQIEQGEPVFDLVDLRQRLALVVPFEDGEDRLEDLLLADAHVHGDVGEHPGLQGETLCQIRVPPPLDRRRKSHKGKTTAEYWLVYIDKAGDSYVQSPAVCPCAKHFTFEVGWSTEWCGPPP